MIEIDATHPIYPYHFATIGSIPNLCFEDDNEIMNLKVNFEVVISSYEFFLLSCFNLGCFPILNY